MNEFTGQDVIDFRERRNMSRKALADAAGLTEGKVWRIEKKGTIHDDERRALGLVGVTSTDIIGSGAVPLPPPPQPADEQIEESSVRVAVIAEPEPVEMDWPAALSTAERLFDRYVSNSEVQTFKRCRRKWWLSWHRGLVQKSESPIGVRQIGNRLHRALSTHYSPGRVGNLLEALEREIALDRAQLDTNTAEEVVKQFAAEADLERIILEGYLEWLKETGADAEIEIISSETYIEAGLPELPGVAIIGKIDVRVRRTLDGVRLFLDHKSVANITQPVLMLPLDEQMKHYHLLEVLQGGEERTAGALYNMLRRVKRTARATPPFYSRVEVRHNDIELATYRARVVGEITDMLAVEDALGRGASHHEVAYPRPSRDCLWDCPFLAVCPMFDDGSRAEDMLNVYFAQRDPLEYYLEDVLGESQ